MGALPLRLRALPLRADLALPVQLVNITDQPVVRVTLVLTAVPYLASLAIGRWGGLSGAEEYLPVVAFLLAFR